MIRRPPRSAQGRSSAASDVYKRQPQDVYDRPAGVFVAQFIGTPPMNMLPPGLLGSADVQVGVRAEDLQPTSDGRVEARVHQIEHLGHEVLVLAESEAIGRLVSRMAPSAGVPMVGEVLRFDAAESSMHRFDAVTGKRLP